MTKLKICLIDDNEGYLQALAWPLFDRFSVHLFTSSDDFLSEMQNGSNPDVICLDYRIPGMNGVELAKKVRLRDRWVPIILISGYVDKNVAMEALAAGVMAVVEKPCSMEHFMEVLDRAVSVRSSSRSAVKRQEFYQELLHLYAELAKESEARYVLAENKLLELDSRALSGRDIVKVFLKSVSSLNAFHRKIEAIQLELQNLEKNMLGELGSIVSPARAKEWSSLELRGKE